MIRKTLIAVLLLTASAAANAEAPKTNGAYIGASGGVSIFDEDVSFGVFYDDEDTAFQAYGGYRFFKHFGVEARYANFGTFSDGFVSVDITSLSVHAVGFIPFGESGWELFGQLGLAQVNQQVSGFFDEDNSAVSAGVGVRWHINSNIALGAQIDASVWENDFGFSQYDSSVATELLSFQVNF